MGCVALMVAAISAGIVSLILLHSLMWIENEYEELQHKHAGESDIGKFKRNLQHQLIRGVNSSKR